MLLAIGIVVNVIVKIQFGVPPLSTLMLSFGVLAPTANLYCLLGDSQ